jgi:hypothetical protein
MAISNIFKSKTTKFLEVCETLLDTIMPIAEPDLRGKLNAWDLSDPYLVVTLGYIRGFIDAAYQSSMPKTYDEKYVDPFFIASVEKHLNWVRGIEHYLRICKTTRTAGVSGLLGEIRFVDAMIIGGNDFVNFLNRTPFWFPRLIGLLDTELEKQTHATTEKSYAIERKTADGIQIKIWQFEKNTEILRNKITFTEYTPDNYDRDVTGYILKNKFNTRVKYSEIEYIDRRVNQNHKEDFEIGRQEEKKQTASPSPHMARAQYPLFSGPSPHENSHTLIKHRAFFIFLLFGLVIIWAILKQSSTPEPLALQQPLPKSAPLERHHAPSSKPITQDQNVPSRSAYTRPMLAPNGSPWPNTAAYLRGEKRLHTSGLSTVTIDNSQNQSDVFVKLFARDIPKNYPVRQFYIPAGSTFTLNKVTMGMYDIRYRDLNNGGLYQTDAFNLEEIPIEQGTRFSKYTMTLYKVRDGNMQTLDISEDDFDEPTSLSLLNSLLVVK